jgi:Tfp pilus assembly pilus retraction ATPase PilT
VTSMLTWLEALVAAKGSDLHLKVGSPPRMRVDGRLVGLDGPNFTPDMAEELLRDLIRPDLYEEFKKTNEADFAYSLPGVGRFRVNAFRQRGSVGREVRVDTDDFTIAMRAAMRQDPDVILVGEIRDAETLKTSLAAAETGHLVLSTLPPPTPPRP